MHLLMGSLNPMCVKANRYLTHHESPALTQGGYALMLRCRHRLRNQGICCLQRQSPSSLLLFHKQTVIYADSYERLIPLHLGDLKSVYWKQELLLQEW